MAGVKGRSGRKRKDIEDKASTNAIRGIREVFGDDYKFFVMIAQKANDGSFNHARLLCEYAYGKPNSGFEVEEPKKNLPDWMVKALKEE